MIYLAISFLTFNQKEFNEFRSKCGLLWSYDWVSIPLVYTQVRTSKRFAQSSCYNEENRCDNLIAYFV